MMQIAPSFVILVITGLSKSSNPTPLKNRRLITVSRESLPRLREFLNPADVSSPEWLGLVRLLDVASYPHIIIKVWDVSKQELLRDIQRAPELDQSALFRKALGEGLGAFTSQPVGLILADLYLTSEHGEIDLALALQAVAAECAAPALVGVSNFPTNSPAWLAARGHDESRYLFPLLPRWRSAAHHIGGESWLHPGYLIAMRAAAALRHCDLAEAAANLLPHWAPARAVSFAATAADVLWDAEFESALDEPQCSELRQAGISGVSPASLARPDAFTSLSPAILRSYPASKDTLAHLLLSGYISHRVQDHIRRHRASDSGAAIAQAVYDWFGEHIPIDSAGGRLVTLRNVAIVPDKLRAGLAWHSGAGGVVEQIEFYARGILDDRVPASSLWGGV